MKPDRLALLPHRHRREKDRNNTILAERNPIVRMAGNLENELTVSTFIEELIRWQTADGQSAEDERPGTEAEILIGLLPFQPDLFNALNLPVHLFRDPNRALKLVG